MLALVAHVGTPNAASETFVDRCCIAVAFVSPRRYFVIFVSCLLDNLLDIQPQDHKTTLLILGDRGVA
jgi:hypothetical protein